MAKKPMPPMYDMHRFDEDTRIRTIGGVLEASPGKVLGIVVEQDGEKGDRYLKKLLEWFPNAELVKRVPNCPAKGLETIQVRKKQEIK